MASDTTTVSCTLSPCTQESGLMTSQNTSCLLSFCEGAVARIMVALDVIRKIRPINTVKGEVCFPNQMMPPSYTFQGQLWGGNSYQFAYSHGSSFFRRFSKQLLIHAGWVLPCLGWAQLTYWTSLVSVLRCCPMQLNLPTRTQKQPSELSQLKASSGLVKCPLGSEKIPICKASLV